MERDVTLVTSLGLNLRENWLFYSFAIFSVYDSLTHVTKMADMNVYRIFSRGVPGRSHSTKESLNCYVPGSSTYSNCLS